MAQRIAYPDNPVMAMAWASHLQFIASQDEARAAFKEETGHDLDSVLHSRGINAMIDQATGHRDAVLDAFVDWVNENFWGDDPFASTEGGDND